MRGKEHQQVSQEVDTAGSVSLVQRSRKEELPDWADLVLNAGASIGHDDS